MFTQKNRFTIGADQLDIRAADLQQHGPVVFVVHILQILYSISEIFYQEKKGDERTVAVRDVSSIETESTLFNL